MKCFRCGRELENDDIGAYKKFHDREAEQFLCVPCFCVDLGCTEGYLRERIAFLRENGCLLFPPKEKTAEGSASSGAPGAARK